MHFCWPEESESDSVLSHEQDISRLKIDEPLFLPPTVGDFVAKDHLARFVLERSWWDHTAALTPLAAVGAGDLDESSSSL